MADITSSLFPEVGSLFQRQQQQNMEAAQANAQGGWQNALRGSIGRLAAQSGGLLGKGITGVLGMTSPEEDEIRATKEIADRLTQQGVNLQSYAGMAQLSQELNQRGLYNAASKAMTAANVLREKESAFRKTEAQTKLDIANAEKTKTTASAGTEAERLRTLIANAEIKLSSGETLTNKEAAEVRWAAGMATKPKYITDQTSGVTTVIPALDLNTYAPNIAKFLATKGTSIESATTMPSTTMQAAPATETPLGTTTTAPTTGYQTIQTGTPKGLDASLVKAASEVEANISTVKSSITDAKKIQKEINNLDVGFLENIGRAGSSFLGINVKDRLAYDATRRSVLSQANNLLMLAKGTQTEGDATRALASLADENTWKNKDALKAAYENMLNTLDNTQKALEVKRDTILSKGQTIPSAGTSSKQGSRDESIINKVMEQPQNKGKSREAVIKALKAKGII